VFDELNIIIVFQPNESVHQHLLTYLLTHSLTSHTVFNHLSLVFVLFSLLGFGRNFSSVRHNEAGTRSPVSHTLSHTQ